jgi:hypothetical protein
MSCHTMPRILKLLLDFNPNFNPNFFLVDRASNTRVRIDQTFKRMKAWILVTKMQEYKPNFLCIIDQFNEAELENYSGLPKGEFQCYSRMAKSKCTLQNLTSQCQWKLDAHVSALKSPW